MDGISKHKFITKGTCTSEITFELEEGKIRNLSFKRGCDGNLKAISALAEGADALEIAGKLQGIQCGPKNTSCADQLASAIRSAVNTR